MQVPDAPNNRSPMIGDKGVATSNRIAVPATIDSSAITLPLKWAGIVLGIINTAGILAIYGIAATMPAVAGENPLVSNIFGSQAK